ncbi:MAG: preprotein translocase subunit YajC [Acidimicrobiales bacterium]
MNIVVLVVLMGALYAFMILPQQKRMKAHQQLVNSLAEGDLVVTNSGIFGAIAEVEDTVVWLEVAPDVELKISKSAIAERISDTDDEDDADDDDELVDVDADDGDV